MALNNCRIIELPKIQDQRGTLSFVESSNHIPFDIRRVFYIYDVASGSDRGSHAHKTLEQFVIAMAGGFSVALNDGKKKKRFALERSHYGLYVPPMTWVTIGDFVSGSVCMVLASERYDEADYIRDFDRFLAAARQ